MTQTHLAVLLGLAFAAGFVFGALVCFWVLRAASQRLIAALNEHVSSSQPKPASGSASSAPMLREPHLVCQQHQQLARECPCAD